MAKANEHIYKERALVVSAQVPERHRSQAQAARAVAFAVAPALLAASAAFLFAACLSVPALACMLAAGVTVAGALGALASAERHRGKAAMAAVALTCAALMAALALPDARSGLFCLVNGIVSHFNHVFGTWAGLIPGYGAVCGSPAFGICFGVVVGVISWAVTRLRITSTSLLIVVALCSVTTLLGLGNAPVGCGLAVAGWLTHCRAEQLRHSARSLASLAIGGASSACAVVAVFALCCGLYAPAPAVDALRAGVAQAADQARYGSDSLPRGNLRQASAMNASQDATLELSFDGSISDDVLLRGFQGATLEGAVWLPLDHDAFEGQWTGMRSWLGANGLAPAYQRADFDDEAAAAGQDETPVKSLQVNNVGADARFVYTPYTLRSLDGALGAHDLDAGLHSGFVGARFYRFTMDDVPAADMLADTAWLSGRQDGYAGAEGVYAAFAESSYLQVSESEKRDVERLLFGQDSWNAEDVSDYAVISRVRTMLDATASYTASPATVPEGIGEEGATTFTSWFLEQQREGGPAYFATVATLAFRSQGIPARYVEGYRVDADRASAAAESGQPVTLTAADAHAWCEVYLNGLGWTPIEVTPGFYTQTLQADNVMDVSEAVSSGNGSVMDPGSVAGEMGSDAEREAQRSRPLSVRHVVGIASIVLGAALAGIAAAFAQRALRRHLRVRLCGDDRQHVCVPALYQQLTRLMAAGAPTFDATRPLECAADVPAAFPGIDQLDYKRAIQLHQAFAFGGRPLKPNELRTVRSFNDRLAAALPKPGTAAGRARRFFADAL
ncbi:transglutaminase family protein [uncultured Senegalimassilia sp.]|uniref:transglutaminase-like domain-containing protein n=1 Tax=uncultured Senegalimassilia sp. TaxID=1714350 RepID=UPI0025FA4EA9|nr:transglutaminase-like domain-containing protein [uncultured Senegalimassilia sp.]